MCIVQGANTYAKMRCLFAKVSHSAAMLAIKSDFRVPQIGVAGRADRQSASNAGCVHVPSTSSTTRCAAAMVGDGMPMGREDWCQDIPWHGSYPTHQNITPIDVAVSCHAPIESRQINAMFLPNGVKHIIRQCLVFCEVEVRFQGALSLQHGIWEAALCHILYRHLVHW